MRIPRRIVVSGMEWTIRISDRLSKRNPPLWGLCSIQKKQITIDPGCPKLETLLHEVVHAIESSMGADWTEEQVEYLARYAATFVSANKPLIRWLLEMLAD